MAEGASFGELQVKELLDGLLQVLVEPSGGAKHDVAAVRGIGELVALVRVDDELRRHAQRDERVPEFVRLWRRTFTVAVAHQN